MLVVAVVLCLVSTGLAVKEGTYVVTAPKIARIGTPYTVSVLLTGLRDFIQNGSIVLSHERDGSMIVSTLFSLDPTEHKTDVQMSLSVGSLDLIPGKYQMKLVLDGLPIKHVTEIELKEDSGAILVQTDKGIYKRSQTVKMRTFIMGVDLKAVKKPVDITIIDPDGNKVERFKNQMSNSGVVTQEYTISNDPKLGEWKIQIQQTNGKGNMAERTFKVDAYVLPRFSVEVKPLVSYVYVKDFSSVGIDVEAMYNYGEGVHGQVLLKYTLDGITREKVQRLVDGKSTITISTNDIGDPSELRQKFCGRYCWYSYQSSFPMDIIAEVEEDETKEKHNGKSSLNFYTEPVAMEILAKNLFRKNMTYTFYLHVTDPSGAPLPMAERTKYFVNINVTTYKMGVLKVIQMPLDTSMVDILMPFTTDKPTEENPSIHVTLVDTNNREILKESKGLTEYQSYGSGGVVINLMETSSGNKVRPPSMMYDVGDTMYVKTTAYSNGGFKMPIFLFLFAKGKLVQSYEVSSDDITSITITPEMNLAPSASLLLYSVTSQNELVADEIKVLVSGLLKNQMTMRFNVERQRVGHDVTLTVNTDPNSFIFLVGIDKGSQLLEAPNDITQGQVKEGLTEFDIREEDDEDDFGGRIMFKRRKRFAPEEMNEFYYGKAAKEILETIGLVYITDAYVAEVNGMDNGMVLEAVADMSPSINFKTSGGKNIGSEEGNEIRKNFPETWIWLNDLSGSDGSFQKTVQLPDTITAWVTRGFALSPTNGLGIASNVQVEGFKQFFIIVSLPATAVRGERLEVKLVVFNYFDDLKSVRIKMNHSPDFEIYNDNLNTTKPVAAGSSWTGTLQVPARLSKGTSVYIKPTTIGKIRIRVEASTGVKVTDVQDTVQKELHVDPEGTTMYGGELELMEATGTMQTLQIIPDFPPEFVSGSRKVVVSVTGDIMGQSLQNLDSMIRAPYGCGEQNMISLVPNIYALAYMTATNNLNPDIQKKAVANIRSGYERELKYQHNNGGYSAFGKRDQSFTTWLTAFVMKSFAQASEFVFIDEDVIIKAKEAIMSQSNRDGSFREPGVVLHKDMMTGTSSGPMLTAYIYISIMEVMKTYDSNRYYISFNSVLTLKYLEEFYKDSSKPKTPFQLAVLSYCFALGDSDQLDSILMEINDIATQTDSGDMKCWCNMRKQQVGGQSKYMTYDIKPSAIETASYVVLTYLEKDDISKAIPIVKWLISQINGKGGWMSTQDTVMGLQALSYYAKKLQNGTKDATVTFKSQGNSDLKFSIDSGNAVLLQSQNLANLDQLGSSGVTVEVEGTGNVVVGVNWEYNVETEDDFQDLHIVITPFQHNSGGIKIEACIWYDGMGDYGMGMMYVDIPTGYQVTNMYDLEQNTLIQRVEMNGKTMAFYFTELSRSKMCIDIHTMVEYIVMDAKPSSARAQFYYAPERRTSAYYSVQEPLSPTSGATCYNIPMALMTLLVAVQMIIQKF